MKRNLAAVAALVVGLLLASEGHGGLFVVALAIAFFLAKTSGSARTSVAGAGSGSNSWFGGARDDARWSTAVHEASHVVAVRRHGGSASARLSANGRAGSYSGSLPDSAPRFADAVVHLAGGVGQRRIVGRDGPSASDLRQAKAALRGTGRSIGDAKFAAARLVSTNRGAILREARKLDGRL